MKPLKSLTIFFPFYNDEGTALTAVEDAFFYGKKLTNNLEVIAIHGGNSKDNTAKVIKKAKKKYRKLIILDKKKNSEGYAVIKHGFYKASKEWVFYTDGDLQYALSDLQKLVTKQKRRDYDVINGYKVNRSDNFIRTLLGKAYQQTTVCIFNLPIRDPDCDFRLIRKQYLKKISLESRDASILPELIKKLERAGATFAEVPVKHYPRQYGRSNYSVISLIKQKILGDIQVWLKLYAFRAIDG